jgi:hypothetical protein
MAWKSCVLQQLIEGFYFLVKEGVSQAWHSQDFGWSANCNGNSLSDPHCVPSILWAFCLLIWNPTDELSHGGFFGLCQRRHEKVPAVG